MYHSFKLDSFSEDRLLAIANYFADWEGTCLLYSGGELDSAERSFLALFPFESVTARGKEVTYSRGAVKRRIESQNPWQGLQDLFFESLSRNELAHAFGFMGYEMGAFADPERLFSYPSSSLTPDAYWEQCAIVVIYEHAAKQAVVIAAVDAVGELEMPEREWARRLSTQAGWQFLHEDLFSPIHFPLQAPLKVTPIADRESIYLSAIDQIKEGIRAGDVYQVNLSQLFVFEGERRPFTVFYQVSRLNPAPFSAYLKAPGYAIVSTSPERFLQKKGEALETRPIKGTIQRGKNAEEDLIFKRNLLESPKEKSELLMITDLMRNDLGKISRPGSVDTIDIWRCEAYTNVFHLISIIRSRAQAHLRPLELIRSCFPGGSITGCPKLKAMELIQSLENRPRGVYTGSLGYVTGENNFDLNIAIRTLVFASDCIHLQLGGGIVIDSNPEQEYQETLFKGDSLFKTLQKGEKQ